MNRVPELDETIENEWGDEEAVQVPSLTPKRVQVYADRVDQVDEIVSAKVTNILSKNSNDEMNAILACIEDLIQQVERTTPKSLSAWLNQTPKQQTLTPNSNSRLRSTLQHGDNKENMNPMTGRVEPLQRPRKITPISSSLTDVTEKMKRNAASTPIRRNASMTSQLLFHQIEHLDKKVLPKANNVVLSNVGMPKPIVKKTTKVLKSMR